MLVILELLVNKSQTMATRNLNFSNKLVQRLFPWQRCYFLVVYRLNTAPTDILGRYDQLHFTQVKQSINLNLIC